MNRRIYPDGRSPKVVAFSCGVYQIIHRPTLRRYVGSSEEVEKRLYLHLCLLRVNEHHCRYLQNIWNKYEGDGFKFFLLEECPLDELINREQYHIDNDSVFELMNSRKEAGASRGWNHSPETRKKISVAAKRIAADPEERRRRSERAKKAHAEGRIPSKPFKPLRPRTCESCKIQFVPIRLPSGMPSFSKWCDKCRKPHRGGYYKTATPR